MLLTVTCNANLQCCKMTHSNVFKIHLRPSCFVTMFMASIPRIATQPKNTRSIISILSIPFLCIRARKEERIDSFAMELDVYADAPWNCTRRNTLKNSASGVTSLDLSEQHSVIVLIISSSKWTFNLLQSIGSTNDYRSKVCRTQMNSFVFSLVFRVSSLASTTTTGVLFLLFSRSTYPCWSGNMEGNLVCFKTEISYPYGARRLSAQ